MKTVTFKTIKTSPWNCPAVMILDSDLNPVDVLPNTGWDSDLELAEYLAKSNHCKLEA